MSRVGKMPVIVPDKIQVSISGRVILVKGPLGELSFSVPNEIEIVLDGNKLIFNLLDDTANALWGTTRAIVNNMVVGVSVGYTKSLEIIGVGYKFELQGASILLSIGYSHKVNVELPKGISASMDDKLKNVIHFKGIDKQLIGEFVAKIRSMKKPEPYKGKGIRYLGEQIKTKAGKTGAKK